MTIEIRLNGKIVQRSRNLRGIISRAFKIGVLNAAVHRAQHGALLYVRFEDGSQTHAEFADFSVCRDWTRARRKRWGCDYEVRNSDNYWSFFRSSAMPARKQENVTP